MLKFSAEQASGFVDAEVIESLKDQAEIAHRNLQEGKGAGSDFLGWVKQPTDIDRDELKRIKEAAKRIREDVDVLVVIGIGGSYLGARAVIDALTDPIRGSETEILYAGHQLSSGYMASLQNYLQDKTFAINVISKSGTTTEPAIAFRILKAQLEKQVGEEKAGELIFVTTDAVKGALKDLSTQVGYETFVVPDDIGGRFSVLSAVGLLPIAVAGIDIDELLAGAAEGQKACSSEDVLSIPAVRYASYRTALMRRGFDIEILVNYDPALTTLSEWWKQLFGESEGKDNRGLFPASVNNTTDLHSMGQYIQEGQRILFETVLFVDEASASVQIPEDDGDLDALNYLAGEELHEINRKAMLGTTLAHVDGGVPNLALTLSKLDARALGELIYFFEYACGISAHMNAVNPFNQPGVEAYKINMFALLGKSGFEAERAELEKRLG